MIAVPGSLETQIGKTEFYKEGIIHGRRKIRPVVTSAGLWVRMCWEDICGSFAGTWMMKEVDCALAPKDVHICQN